MNNLAEAGLIESVLSPCDWLIVQKRYRPDETPKYETLFTLANGFMGTRGAYEEPVPRSHPATYIAGVFDRTMTFNEELANAPNWLGLEVRINGELMSPHTGKLLSCMRWLDMRNGILARRMRWRDGVGRITRLETLRLVHLCDKHRALIRGVVVPENHDAHVEIFSQIDGTAANTTLSPIIWVRHFVPRRAESLASGGMYLEAETFSSRIAVGVASNLVVEGEESRHVDIVPNKVVERVAADGPRGTALSFAKHICVFTSRETKNVRARALAELRAMKRDGAEAIVRAHCSAWHEAWASADVEISGDRESQRAVRFSIFHLLGLANERDDVSVAAKGLHGDGYRGHVFWDTEMFILPFYIYTNPRAARTQVMYRLRRLDAAKANAAKNGFRGVQFPWESATTGAEVTPANWYDPITLIGEEIRVQEQQHHVTADVAYGLDHYLRATGERRFLVEHAAELFVETARFWASRVRLDARKKRYVVTHVIGPDEAHEDVDNNRYTNRLAAWSLLRGCEAVEELRRRAPREWRRLNVRLRVQARELANWRRIARRMWYPPTSSRGVLEQHEGYFKLRPARLRFDENDMPVLPRPPREKSGSTRKGLGTTQETLASTQLIKQADIVLLQYLFPDDFDLRSKRVNYAYYAPRTTHLSSLSPSTYAIMGVEVGDMREARRNFRRTAFMDLDNHQGSAAKGIHAAALGGTWMAVVNGFGGMRPAGDGTLSFAPRLPEQWRRLRFRIHWRGARLELTCTARQVLVEHLGGGRGDACVTVWGKEVTLRPGERRSVRRPALAGC